MAMPKLETRSAMKQEKLGLTGDIFINGKYIGRGKVNLLTSKRRTKTGQIPKVLSAKMMFYFENAKSLKKFLSYCQITTVQYVKKIKNHK